jgi:two-component system, LytTR family, response regulator
MKIEDFQKKRLRSLLIDADVNSLREISRVIMNNPATDLVNTCKTGRAAVNVIKEMPIDLIFMNPALPDANGFDLIASLDIQPIVVIISDRQDYAYYAYRIDAVDYRLKPYTPDLLSLSLERVYRRLLLNHHLNND